MCRFESRQRSFHWDLVPTILTEFSNSLPSVHSVLSKLLMLPMLLRENSSALYSFTLPLLWTAVQLDSTLRLLFVTRYFKFGNNLGALWLVFILFTLWSALHQ